MTFVDIVPASHVKVEMQTCSDVRPAVPARRVDFPGAHFKQPVAEEVAPSDVPYVAFRHGVHEELPLSDAYDPAGQRSHVVAPSADENVPGSQILHAAASSVMPNATPR